jgi:hypothetical protein
MNSRHDELTQEIVSDFAPDTSKRTPECPTLFYSDRSAAFLLKNGPAYFNIFPTTARFAPTHLPGAAHQTRETADKYVRPSRFVKTAAYRIVVRLKDRT